jgi:Leucine-rich repeat (LRR) protein
LDRNAFTKFPEVICELTQLESLSFEGHQAVCQIPLSLSNLRNLTTLHLAQCCLSEFPETICTSLLLCTKTISSPNSIVDTGLLTSLKTLNLAGNFLSSLPKSAKQLTSLQVLNISFNDFSALPKVLKQMKSLDLVLTAGNKTHFVWPIATSACSSLKLHYL